MDESQILKRITGKVRRAIQDYQMIHNGDNIAIGVSGGKDSLTLLLALSQLKHYYPEMFSLQAITLTLGIGVFDVSPVQSLCKKLDIPLTVVETQIGSIVFDIRREENPCSMCANLRRGALHNTALELGCNKVALAHHRDDVIETFLLSTLYEGRLHTFSPVTYLDRKQISLIRPLIYIEEKEIKEYIKAAGLTPVKNPCSVNGHTKRQYVKELIENLRTDNKEIKNNLFGAIKRSGIDGWKNCTAGAPSLMRESIEKKLQEISK